MRILDKDQDLIKNSEEKLKLQQTFNSLQQQIEKLKIDVEAKEKRLRALERYEQDALQATEKYVKLAKINDELKGLVD
jgi:signal transduction histidine kinase